VLSHLKDAGIEQLISVGDIVGYGADPVQCIDLLIDNHAVVVSGNHDQAVTGRLDDSFFNLPARQAAAWTREQLDESRLCWLDNLPLTEIVDGCVTVAHATIHQPELFEYIQSYADAAYSLNALTTKVGFLGHSHVPAAFLKGDTLLYSAAPKLNLSETSRALINVGSIGQPRDENPKAACAVYDADNNLYELHRVAYDIEGAARAIIDAGLPDLLADRLVVGQ
jgi:diadenosine tetraphosphatase ApaH/serine/threonine PP2A family protein phosphatase